MKGMKNTDCEAHHSAVFCIVLLLPPSLFRIFAPKLHVNFVFFLCCKKSCFRPHINGWSSVIPECGATQEIHRLWNPKADYRVHKGPAACSYLEPTYTWTGLLVCVRYFNAAKLRYWSAAPSLAESKLFFNHLTPNDHFSGRTAALTYRWCIFIFIQQIYVLNILNTLHTLRFFLFKMSFIS
jgi:hypothetical protein